MEAPGELAINEQHDDEQAINEHDQAAVDGLKQQVRINFLI
jgi:hypothetical protein